MGIAFQKLPDATAGATGRYGGLHAQISVVDVGQFLSYASTGSTAGKLPAPQASSPFMFGGQFGALVGTPTNALMIGVDARYAPGVLQTDQNKNGAFRIGAVVGYYIPFFDFN